MRYSKLFLILAIAVPLSPVGARAQTDLHYPDWTGQWNRMDFGGGGFDPSRPPGRGQQPPLTPEYQHIWEGNLAEEATGGQSYNPMARCIPTGMPRMMIAYQPMEIIVTPGTTYISFAFLRELRRIYTDGQRWPASIPRSFSGYSIGRWIDEDGDGRFDVLEIETRGFKGPRLFEASGIPLHRDNQTVIKERIFLDRSNPDVLRDEITTLDHALTRPWTVMRRYRRNRNPTWVEDVCEEGNNYVFIGKETYFLSADGFLMPTRKNQSPPTMRNFFQH